MADRPISELTAATQVNPPDLFVMEQSGTAKKLTGQILENFLLELAKGRGGILDVVFKDSDGLTDTYIIKYSKSTETTEFKIKNGKSIVSITKTATSGLVDTYTITYNDKTTTTFTITNGAKGDKGDNTYLWVKYASTDPQTPPHSFGDIPDRWLGIYAGPKSSAPTLWSEYKWYEIKGAKGDTGAPATLASAKIEYQASTSGTVVPSGVWSETVPTVPKGKYLWTRTTTKFNSGNPIVSYSIAYIGRDGTGLVNSVNGIEAVDGNVEIPTVIADLLWENAAPTSTFYDQNIIISNKANYDAIAIISLASAAQNPLLRLPPIIFKQGGGVIAYSNVTANTAVLVSREVTQTDTGLSFKTAYGSDLSSQYIDNNACIPFKIYGLKGIK